MPRHSKTNETSSHLFPVRQWWDELTNGTRPDTLFKHAEREGAQNGVGFIGHRVEVVSSVGRHHLDAFVRVFYLTHRRV